MNTRRLPYLSRLEVDRSNDQHVGGFGDRGLLVVWGQYDLSRWTVAKEAAGISRYARQPLKSHRVGRV